MTRREAIGIRTALAMLACGIVALVVWWIG